MNNWLWQWGSLAFIAVAAGGCCCQPGGGLVNNVNGSRIAAPGTGSIQFPRTASLTDPYYGSNANAAAVSPSAPGSVNTAQGWRPAGSVPVPVAPGSSMPTSYVAPRTTPVTPIPANNTSVASSTSTLHSEGNLQVAQSTTGLPQSPGGPTMAHMGMPVNDVSAYGGVPNQVATANNGIFGRTWEYVVRPTAPTQQSAWPNGPNPNYPGSPYANPGVMTAGNLLVPPVNYTATPYGGYNYSQGMVADGWRQRESTNGVPR